MINAMIAGLFMIAYFASEFIRVINFTIVFLAFCIYLAMGIEDGFNIVLVSMMGVLVLLITGEVILYRYTPYLKSRVFSIYGSVIGTVWLLNASIILWGLFIDGYLAQAEYSQLYLVIAILFIVFNTPRVIFYSAMCFEKVRQCAYEIYIENEETRRENQIVKSRQTP